MILEKNVDLRLFSTMRLGGRASHAMRLKNKFDVVEAVKYAKENELEILVVGKGSNIIWQDSGFSGLLLINEIEHLDVIKNENNWQINVGAGNNWDAFVEYTTKNNLTGIEALSLIPGTVGATPVQNVGAYGQEVSQTIESIEAYDIQSNNFVNFKKSDCQFGYRTSRFKTEDSHSYIITSISFKLSKDLPVLPLYPAAENYFKDNNIKVISSPSIRDAVINIRTNKLPDPDLIANNGSFFKNPVISPNKYNQLIEKFPNIAYWETEDGNYKIPAAWLIENVGMKGYDDPETGMSIWPKQAVVFVNKNAKTTSDLLKFKHKITKLVLDKYGIELEQEPEILP
jgi:UDP-N-acetylmuramate dehydrogenase